MCEWHVRIQDIQTIVVVPLLDSAPHQSQKRRASLTTAELLCLSLRPGLEMGRFVAFSETTQEIAVQVLLTLYTLLLTFSQIEVVTHVTTAMTKGVEALLVVICGGWMRGVRVQMLKDGVMSGG